jgi:hypothetical protein
MLIPSHSLPLAAAVLHLGLTTGVPTTPRPSVPLPLATVERQTQAAPSTVKPDAAPKPVVLFDLGHGQAFFSAEPGRETPRQKAYAEILESLGLGMKLTTQRLSKEVLAGCRTLVLVGPSKPIEAAEVDSIFEFVNQGGALLLVVDEERRQSLADSRANAILARFGLTFTGDTPYIHNRGAVAPAGRIHPVDREIPYSGGRAVEGGTPFSFVLEPDGKPSMLAHAAWTETLSGGRVIAMGDAMAPLLLGTPEAKRLGGGIRPGEYAYWGKDSRDFMIEVISWLTYRTR